MMGCGSARFFLARRDRPQSSPASTKAAKIFPFPWPALGVGRLLLLLLPLARLVCLWRFISEAPAAVARA
jgi:hypothetical protein